MYAVYNVAATAVLAAGDRPLSTHCCWLESLITVVQIETRTSPGICALSPGNEISQELTYLVYMESKIAFFSSMQHS